MYILFIDGKTHYHDDVNLINLQIQIQPKAPHRIWQADPKSHM